MFLMFYSSRSQVSRNLLDEETLQSDILGGFVRKCHGDDVG